MIGCDASQATLDRFRQEGGLVASTPAGAAVGVSRVLCVVVNAAQTEAVLFGPDGCTEVMPRGAVFVACASMDPDIARRLAARLEAATTWTPRLVGVRAG